MKIIKIIWIIPFILLIISIFIDLSHSAINEQYFQNCIIPEWSIRFRDNIKNPMFQKIREKAEDASKLIEPTVEITEEIPKE